MSISREQFIVNVVNNTRDKIKACSGVRKELKELLLHEKHLADIYEDDGARDTARIIHANSVTLIEEALRETVISKKVDEQ